MKRTLLKAAILFAATTLSATGFAQSNLGASCGCPPVASRPTVNLSARATYAGLPNDYELNANVVLTCDTTYILDQKIYVTNGKAIVIHPGTVIKGAATVGGPENANALIIEKGGKIFADGTKDCPIVFTTVSDDMSGTYGFSNRGKWGGVVLLGKATNNLTVAANGPAGAGKLAVADGIGYIEGFNFANGRNQFGMAPGSADDNDNSGIMRYVSIRHAGAILAVGNELNSLTLGSVGRGTTLDHIEIVSGDDDGIEFFGGTVNIKYASVLFGADDMFDWDLGWSGKAQFLFGLKSDNATSPSDDNGFEMDADDNKSNNTPRSHPVIYNSTIIGNGDNTSVGDNSGPFAINAKELTEGEIYNSIFANFRAGFNMTKAVGTRTGGAEAYNNWINGSLVVKCNTFIGNTDSITVDKVIANVLAGDRTKFTADGNSSVSTIAGFDYIFAANSANNTVSNTYDATPTPALPVSQAGCSAAPIDGFFTYAPYKGAFDPNGSSWMSTWAYTALIKAGLGLGACPTDINADGITNNSDFLDLLGKFNQNCE